MDDSKFLSWLRDRLINVYGEDPNTDFVKRFERIIEEVRGLEALVPELQKMHAELTGMVRDLRNAKR